MTLNNRFYFITLNAPWKIEQKNTNKKKTSLFVLLRHSLDQEKKIKHSVSYPVSIKKKRKNNKLPIDWLGISSITRTSKSCEKGTN
jgi:hypothetical protein